jgi:L-alanine-DL-glutamate epimerase-like enolase superfamily enzyme
VAGVIETDEGITGIGYTRYNVEDLQLMKTFIEDKLATMLLGEDPYTYESLWDKMWRGTYRIGRRGLPIHAIGIVDQCLWDIVTKAAGQPLYKYLGAYRERVPVYANVNYQVSPEELGEWALKYIKKGYPGVKIGWGRNLEIATAFKRVQAVREAIGPEAGLAIDSNGNWDRETAIRTLRKMEKYDIYWAEEPISPDDFEGLAMVAGSTSIPIAAGGANATRYDFRRLMTIRPAIRFIQPAVHRVGGITEWLKVAQTAVVLDVAVATYALKEVHIHLAAASPSVFVVELHATGNPGQAAPDAVFQGDDSQYDLKDGTMRPPDEPGIGLKFRKNADQYRVA